MVKNHPSKDIQGQLSNSLKGKKIILGICGSVGAVKSSELARLLIRHGAEIIPVMSKAACNLIHPDLMSWSTGNETITKLSGNVEHVMHAGNVKEKADLMVIFPATANTISKISCGIDDTVVTTFSTTAIGEGIPMVIVPAMHLPMYKHKAVTRNIKQLKEDGISIIDPVIEEGKAKVASPESVCLFIIDKLNGNKNLKLSGKKVLITSGRTIEKIDPFRVITNRSSGKMGAALTEAALLQGAEVTIVSGLHSATYSDFAKVIETESSNEMLVEVTKELQENKFDFVICAGAVSDWKAKQVSQTKISTSVKELNLTLVPTQKIVDTVKEISPNSFLVAFRALSGLSDKEMVKDGIARMKQAKADMIAINEIGKKGSGFESDNNRMILVDNSNQTQLIETSTKSECAKKIINSLV